MSRLSRREFLKVTGLTTGMGAIRGLNGCYSLPDFFPLPGPSAKVSADLGQFDYVVVLMMENRSFDNLAGYLYAPGEPPRGQSFEGVIGKDLSNPIPPYADQASLGYVPVGQGTVMDNPNPEPGNSYPHMNTQIFGTVLPADNAFKQDKDMQSPYNAPDPVPSLSPMNGFVTDYINNFTASMGRSPTYDEYRIIMDCFPPETLPVVSTLARQFAICDHWYSSVPSATNCNRAFFNAASSSGFVLNTPYTNWVFQNQALTIFNRIESYRNQGLSWRVYFDAQDIFSATGLLHFPRLWPYAATRFSHMDDFYNDVHHGRLPRYSFIEPRLFINHNDMHPPQKLLGVTQPSSVLAGELLINQVYDAIRTSDCSRGNNYRNTLLVITFDEAGGCYDHVSPPSATPPDATHRPAGQMGFQFDRLGPRVPTLLVSAFIEPGTVISNPLEHTSVIRTVCKKWGLPPLTDRDASAPDLGVAFNRTTPRDRGDWPVITPTPVPAQDQSTPVLAQPLNSLQKDIVGMVAAANGESPQSTAGINTLGQAIDYLRNREGTVNFNP
jgi:phospholipase C